MNDPTKVRDMLFRMWKKERRRVTQYRRIVLSQQQELRALREEVRQLQEKKPDEDPSRP